jgi:hypothetical protein
LIMDGFRRSIQANFVNLLLVLLAGGFLVLLVELVLFQHWQGIQLVAIGSVLLGLILTVAALFVQGGGANVIGVLLLLVSLTGLIGVFEHYQARLEEAANFQRFAQGQGGFPGAQAGLQATNQQASGQQANAQGTPAPVEEGSRQGGQQTTGRQGGGQFGQGGFVRGQGRGRFGAGAGGGLSFREPVPPPLAPLSLTGLSLLSAIVVFGATRKVTAGETEPSPATTARFEQGAVKR